MNDRLKEVVISREDAVFWMDDCGCWHNRHGKFRHPRIIRYFNAAIRRDDDGYYVSQDRESVREKVYFNYAETPLFAVDVDFGPEPILVLNTGARHPIDPGRLFLRNDRLYMELGDELVKFTDRAAMGVAQLLEDSPAGMAIRIGGKDYLIGERD